MRQLELQLDILKCECFLTECRLNYWTPEIDSKSAGLHSRLKFTPLFGEKSHRSAKSYSSSRQLHHQHTEIHKSLISGSQ